MIYTNVGDILLAVNPFKELPIYTKATQKKYDIDAPEKATNPPHVYDVARRALQVWI